MENKKEFTIGYIPMEAEFFLFHMDFSHEPSEEHRATLALVHGVNMIKNERYHMCIQKLPISPVSDIDLMYDLQVIMNQFGFRVKGLSIQEAYNRGCEIKKQMNQDPMIPVVTKFIDIGAHYEVNKLDKHNISSEHIKIMIEDLEDELTIAVWEEKYEEAAKLRDKIINYKNDLKNKKI